MTSDEIVAALWAQLRKHEIHFEEGLVPEHPLYSREWHGLYFAKTGLLSQTPDKMLNFCNMAASKLFGYAKGELEGLPSLVLVPERFREDRNNMFDDILRNDKVVRNHEAIRLKKNGSEIPIIATVFRYEFSRGVYSIAAAVEPR